MRSPLSHSVDPSVRGDRVIEHYFEDVTSTSLISASACSGSPPHVVHFLVISKMIYHQGASLSEHAQFAELMFCHGHG